MPADVLVLGGGFAGLAAVNTFTRRGRDAVRVRLVDRCRDSVFSPLLPDLVSGRISPASAAYPLAPHCRRRGAEFVHADVRSFDPGACAVETDAGTMTADYVICCIGCETNYFGNEQAMRHAPGLKTLAETEAIRRTVASAAGRDGGPSSVLVVGGGYTGFETASHVAQLLHHRLHLPFARLRERVDVRILELADTCLRNLSPPARKWGMRVISDFGVSVEMQNTVREFHDAGTVALDDGRTVRDALVIWTPGVTPGPATDGLDKPRSAGGRLAVQGDLRLPGCERCFAAGDVAGPVDRRTGRPLRMGVQFSLSGGAHAADGVLRCIAGRQPEAFEPFDPGYVLPLAPGKGAGRILGVEMRGFVPLALHYVMSVLRSRGAANRAGIVRDLATQERTNAFP